MTYFRPVSIMIGKELKQFFVSPIAYVVMMIYLTITGYFFFTHITQFSAQYQYLKNMMQMYQNPELLSRLNLNEMVIAPVLFNMMFIFLFILPLIMMRSFAEEEKQKTNELLMTSPITVGQVIMGKFLGSFAFICILVLPTVIYQLVLFIYSSPELGPILTGYLGVMLFAATGVAIGLFASSLTENQIIAAVITFVVLLFLFIINLLTSDQGTIIYHVVQFFSVSSHVQNMLRGLINTKDLLYFGSFIAFFLFMTRRSLEAKGWR